VKVIEDAEQNLSPWQEWVQIETDVQAIPREDEHAQSVFLNLLRLLRAERQVDQWTSGSR